MKEKKREKNKQTTHKQASKTKKKQKKNPHTISFQLQYEETYLSRSSDLQSCDCARQLEDTNIIVQTLTAWRYLFHFFNDFKYKI
jgi:hypothetical protein